jgi:hypothetical protein
MRLSSATRNTASPRCSDPGVAPSQPLVHVDHPAIVVSQHIDAPPQVALDAKGRGRNPGRQRVEPGDEQESFMGRWFLVSQMRALGYGGPLAAN